MIIRKIRAQDTVALAGILNEIIEIGGTTAYEDPITPAYFDRFVLSEAQKMFLHVAEAEERLLGMQWINPNPPPDDHIGGIATFAKVGVTQTGIGRGLFQATRKACHDAGYNAIDAVIRADNLGGIGYYERMGFRDFSVEHGVPLKDGTPVDRVTKRLAL